MTTILFPYKGKEKQEDDKKKIKEAKKKKNDNSNNKTHNLANAPFRAAHIPLATASHSQCVRRRILPATMVVGDTAAAAAAAAADGDCDSDVDAQEVKAEADSFAASCPPPSSLRSSRGVSSPAGSAAGAAALVAPMPMVPDPSLGVFFCFSFFGFRQDFFV